MSKQSGQDSGGYPAVYEQWVELAAGERVFLRPVREDDGGLLTDLFSRLSRQTIHRRFLAFVRSLPDDLLHRFTHLDYAENFALAALIREDGVERAIAVCRYAWHDEAQMPEFACVVRDDWQGKGLGTVLFRLTADASARNGFKRFQCLLEADNQIMAGIIERSGLPYTVGRRGSYVCYEFSHTTIFPLPAP